MSMRSETARSFEVIDPQQVLADFLRSNEALRAATGSHVQDQAQLLESMEFHLMGLANGSIETTAEEVQPTIETPESEITEQSTHVLTYDLADSPIFNGHTDPADLYTLGFKRGRDDFENGHFIVYLNDVSTAAVADAETESNPVINRNDDPVTLQETFVNTDEAKSADDALTDKNDSLSLDERKINELNLEIARKNFARLRMEMRGKSAKKQGNKLQAEYDIALRAYKAAYDVVSKSGTDELKESIDDDETIAALYEFANGNEHERLLQVEDEVYREKYSGFSRGIFDTVNRLSWGKRTALTGTAATAATALFGTALAVTGVGAVLGIATAATIKGAKSISMYKFNKNVRMSKGLRNKGITDSFAVRETATSLNDVEATRLQANDVLFNTIESRVITDMQENRKRLKFAIGAVAVGAVVGSVAQNAVHHLMDNDVPMPTNVGSRINEHLTPNSIHVKIGPLPEQTNHITVTRPGIAPGSRVPAQPLSHDIPSARPLRPTEGPVTHANRVTERPISVSESTTPITKPVELPNVDYTRYTASVAHDFAPGHETVFMQNGINAYNSLHNTHFALTPHNGSTWIIDNGHAINPAQMEELNRLMVEESLKVD